MAGRSTIETHRLILGLSESTEPTEAWRPAPLMTFDLQSCWDCPVSIWITVALLALAIGITGAGIAA
jgi:hypothetical protein